MEIRELRSFCSAARYRSISRAAEHLGMGQPTVTTHIKKLESELDTVLFDRVKRPIQLTLAGKRLQELAVPLVEGLDALVQSASEAEERGPVVLAATPDHHPAHPAECCKRVFTTLHPHIHLTIKSAPRTHDHADDRRWRGRHRHHPALRPGRGIPVRGPLRVRESVDNACRPPSGKESRWSLSNRLLSTRSS